MQKKVFILIVSYNGEHWLSKNLQSLKKSTYPINVIVVDNNSSDASIAIVKSFPEVKLIISDKNIGFGLANNIAIKEAMAQAADYVFLLNQDTWIFPETIFNLVKVAEKNKDFGIISPIHFSGDGVILDQNFKMYWERKAGVLDVNIDEVPFVNAAAWLIPKAVIKKVGLFEPMYSHYGEDRNYTTRVLYHKFKTVVVKDAKICHDRIIKRSFKKDVIQSEFKILTALLNINNSLLVGYTKGFVNVLGLPKYFYTYYSYSKVTQLFFRLMWSYLGFVLRIRKINKKRSTFK